MKFLLLNGHGIIFRVEKAGLEITEGRFTTKEEPKTYSFRPKRIEYDNIVIYGKSGNISIEAIRWLIKHNVQITILDWDGSLLTTIMPPESVQVDTKFAQYSAYSDEKKRLDIAKKIINAKFARTAEMLAWMNSRYPKVEINFNDEARRLNSVKSIKELLLVEGRVAGFYWSQFQKIMPDMLKFESRNTMSRPKGAGDQVNCLLNYGYAILEAECLRAINAVGLDRHVGFIHEKTIGKNSLAYDIQELFRWIIDLAVISLVEREEMETSDFIRTNNYTLKLRPTGARKLIDEINVQINKGINYQGMLRSWHYVLLLKTRELAHYLLGKKKRLDFLNPQTDIERVDTEEMRQKILSIRITKWKQKGYSKGTLSYLKKNARANKPFSINEHVKERILSEYAELTQD